MRRKRRAEGRTIEGGDSGDGEREIRREGERERGEWKKGSGEEWERDSGREWERGRVTDGQTERRIVICEWK